MTQAQHLQIAFDTLYRRRIASGAPSATSFLPFLYVPLPMRLVMLCLCDGAGMAEIKAVLPFAKETDVRLTSHRMIAACRLLDQALANPWIWIRPGQLPEGNEPSADLTDNVTPFPVADRLLAPDTDKQLRQIFYSSVPILLFGEAVPEQISKLSLKARCILYLITTEELAWADVQLLLGCSEWSIRRAIKDAETVLGGL